MDFDYDELPVQPKPVVVDAATGTESGTWNAVTSFFGFVDSSHVQSATGEKVNWYPKEPTGRMYAPPGPTGTVAPPPIPPRKVSPKFEKDDPGAIFPSKNMTTNAAWDLYSISDVKIEPGKIGVIDTGIKIKLEPRSYLKLFSRPERVINDHLLLAIDIIDNDYNGAIKVFLYNTGEEEVEIKTHEKVAQVVIN